MPRMNKGGKFIFGISLVREDMTIRLPAQAVKEYEIAAEGKVYLFTGSRSTGGFCVTRRGLLSRSKLAHILSDNPSLADYSAPQGQFVKYKGRSYCWLAVSQGGVLRMTGDMLDFLQLQPGARLLSIRSSDIAFTMGARGELLERARAYGGFIPEF